VLTRQWPPAQTYKLVDSYWRPTQYQQLFYCRPSILKFAAVHM